MCDTCIMDTPTRQVNEAAQPPLPRPGTSSAACLTEMLFSLLGLREEDDAAQVADRMRTVAWLLPAAIGEGCFAARVIWQNTEFASPTMPATPPHIVHPFDPASRETGSIDLWRETAGPLPPRAQALLEDCGQAVCSCLQQLSLITGTRLRAEQYRAIFDYVTEALFLYDLEGIILDINGAALRLLGADQERLRGRSFGELLPRPDATDLATRIDRIRLRGMTFEEGTLRRLDGRTIPVELTDRLLMLQGRQVILSIARDISERHSAKKALDLRMQREHLVSGVATLLANATPDDLRHDVDTILERLGGFLGARHVWLVEMSADGSRASITQERCAPEATPRRDMLHDVPTAELPWNFRRLRDFETIVIEDAGALGKDNAHERDRHRELGLVSTLAVPLRKKADLIGCLVMDGGTKRRWTTDDVGLAETVASVLGSAMDRMATLREHQNARNHITAILDTLPEQVAVVDNDGHITHVNASWLHTAADNALPGPMRCLPGEDYLSALDESAAHFASAGEAAMLLRSILAGDAETGNLEYEVTAGARRWFLLQIARLTPPLHGAVLSRSDVTPLRQAQADLARSEVRYRMLLDHMQEGLLFTDASGRITFANQPFCTMLERSAENLSGISALALIAPESHAALEALLDPGQEATGLHELTWLTAGGVRAFTLVSPSTLRDAQGGYVGLNAMVTNITHRRILESQLMQAQKLEAVGQLAAGIAHEINSPVQYLGNNLAFLRQAFADVTSAYHTCDTTLRAVRDGRCSPAEVTEALDAISTLEADFLREEAPRALDESTEGVERIAAIVRSVRQFAHPGDGAVILADINKAIESTVNIARNAWKHVAAMQLDLSPGLPPVPCVPSEFNQAILNLLLNAVHAIEDRCAVTPGHAGVISITSRMSAGLAEVSVTDNGVGIPVGNRERVFDPFFTTKEVGRGTGQGLAITRTSIVDKLGGELFFESDTGKGTTFFIRLPLTMP